MSQTSVERQATSTSSAKDETVSQRGAQYPVNPPTTVPVAKGTQTLGARQSSSVEQPAMHTDPPRVGVATQTPRPPSHPLSAPVSLAFAQSSSPHVPFRHTPKSAVQSVRSSQASPTLCSPSCVQRHRPVTASQVAALVSRTETRAPSHVVTMVVWHSTSATHPSTHTREAGLHVCVPMQPPRVAGSKLQSARHHPVASPNGGSGSSVGVRKNPSVPTSVLHVALTPHASSSAVVSQRRVQSEPLAIGTGTSSLASGVARAR